MSTYLLFFCLSFGTHDYAFCIVLLQSTDVAFTFVISKDIVFKPISNTYTMKDAPFRKKNRVPTLVLVFSYKLLEAQDKKLSWHIQVVMLFLYIKMIDYM